MVNRSSTNSEARRFTLGATALFITKILTRVISPAVAILVMRFLGAETYGDLASALALVGVVGALAEFGIGPALLKSLQETPGDTMPTMRAAFRFGVISAAAAALMTAGWMYGLGYSGLRLQLGFLLSATYFLTAFNAVCSAWLQHRGEYGRIAGMEFWASVTNWTSTLVLVLLRVDVRVLTAVPLLLAVIVSLRYYGRYVFLPVLEFVTSTRVSAARILRDASQFAAGNVLYQVYYQSDIVVLSLYAVSGGVGQYAAAYKFLTMAYLISGTLFNDILYARYFQWRVEQPSLFLQTYVLVTKAMLLCGLAIMVGFQFLAGGLIPFLLGPEYSKAVTLLQVLAITVPFRLVASSFGAVLLTSNKMSLRLMVQAVAAVTNLGVNLLVVPTFGPEGAAWATVLSEGIILIGYGVLVHTCVFDKQIVARLKLPLFGAAVFTLALAALGPLSDSLAAVGVGGTLLIGGLYLVRARYLTPTELLNWRKGLP